MERRRDLRFEIRLKCRLLSPTRPQVIDAVTVNLSRSGALLRLSLNGDGHAPVQPGDVLLTEVPLPVHRSFKPRCLSCKAVAVRTFEEEESQVVAVQFEHIEFRPVSSDSALTSSVAVLT